MDYRKIFRKKRTFLPIINAESADQALRNARIAIENGGDGIFLINHGIPASGLLACYEEIRRTYPESRLWIGMNFFDLDRFGAHEALPADAGGLWCHDRRYREGGRDRIRGESLGIRKPPEIVNAADASEIYFASVAFKNQPSVDDPAGAAKAMVPHCDVVVTSGNNIGSPPSVYKIRDMKRAIGDHPLAIASGITPGNARNYFAYADCFMAASGISLASGDFDPAKVRAFADAIKPR